MVARIDIGLVAVLVATVVASCVLAIISHHHKPLQGKASTTPVIYCDVPGEKTHWKPRANGWCYSVDDPNP